jgi:hypothetical protein
MQSDSDRNTDEAPDGTRRRKPKPPIIDLTATEVTPPTEAPAAEAQVDSAATDRQAEAPAEVPASTDAEPTAAEAEKPSVPEGEDLPPADTPPPPADDLRSPSDSAATGPVLTAPQPKTEPPAPPPGTSFASLLTAAVLGGALVLGGGYALTAYGLMALPNQQPPQTQASAIDLTPIQAELTTLSGRIDALNGSGSTTPLDQRVASLEEALKTAPAAPGGDVAALRKAVDDLTTRISSQNATSDVKPDIEALKADLAALKSAPPAVDPQRVIALDGRLAALSDKLDAAATANAALAERVSAIEARLAQGPKGGEIAALSLAVTGLSSKIASGAPFEPEFSLVAASVPDLPELAALKPLAATGVPTQDQLLAGLPVEAMAAARPVDAGNGVIEGLVSSAMSLVNYRETGGNAADPLSQAIDGIVSALKAGDYPAATAAADQLPAWSKPAAAQWREQLDARVTADSTVAALTTRVLTRLQSPAEGQ